MPRSDWIHSGVCCVARDHFLNVLEYLLPQNNAQPEFGLLRWCFHHCPSKHAAGKHECILGFTPAPDTFTLNGYTLSIRTVWGGNVFGSTVVERGYQQYSLEIYCFIRNTQEKQILENTAKTQTGPQWKRIGNIYHRAYLGNSTSERSGKFGEERKSSHIKLRCVFRAKQQYNIIRESNPCSYMMK